MQSACVSEVGSGKIFAPVSLIEWAMLSLNTVDDELPHSLP